MAVVTCPNGLEGRVSRQYGHTKGILAHHVIRKTGPLVTVSSEECDRWYRLHGIDVNGFECVEIVTTHNGVVWYPAICIWVTQPPHHQPIIKPLLSEIKEESAYIYKEVRPLSLTSRC